MKDNIVILTHVGMYSDIAEDAFRQMEEHLEKAHQLWSVEDDWGITMDLGVKRYKSALIYIVFSAMWLEAILHFQIVEHCGAEVFRKVDRKTYEEKFKVLGIDDDDFFTSLEEFRKLRRDLVHEKAHFNQEELLFAEDKARKVCAIIQQVKTHLSDDESMDD